MKRRIATCLFIVATILTLNSCGQSPSSTLTGKTIIVTSAADSGPETLRQALRDAKSGDTITFDPKVFPPGNPTTIFLETQEQEGIALPEITQGNLTIDASNAGVILDGSKTVGEWVNCISIRSDGNVIRGLQIINIPGAGIAIMDGENNIIGGDHTVGSGPLGQGNLSSGNYVGISLQGNGISSNAILGNLVGVAVDGFSERGNQNTGIYVANGASHNTIGPNNIIAFNTMGIQTIGQNTIDNTITKNRIYNNTDAGIFHGVSGNNSLKDIYLIGVGSSNLLPPNIISFDLASGSITVLACPNCTVEIFSDDGTQGKVYEGQGIADNTGVFTLDKGTPLIGPHLTATSTDLVGNTSGFSMPTVEIRRAIQNENHLPKTVIQPKQSRVLEDTRIGVFTESLWHLSWELFPDRVLDPKNIFSMGYKRYRLTINSIESTAVEWDKPELEIDPSQDAFITSLANNGVKVTYVLSFWDIEYAAGGGQIPIPRFKTDEEVQRYLEYVGFIVRHFKDRIEYYEIWNEPELEHTIQWIEVEDYVTLVRRVVPVIQQENPNAKIVVGGLGYLRLPGKQDYLFSILKSDIMPLVDVVSWHPMYGTTPKDDSERQYYYEYPSLVLKIKEAASAHGFTGEYVADELVWRTSELFDPTSNWEEPYSEMEVAKYYARGIVMHLGMDVSITQIPSNKRTWFQTIQNLSAVMAGSKTINLPVTIQSEATIIKTYGFSLPNGDNLLAMWNDGVAVDYDTGIPSTLVIPGYADWMATGIDVLNGFEQELISTSENGNLVIRDFLLKDYPIIIRLSK